MDMLDRPAIAVAAVAVLVAGVVWGRSARRLLRALRRIEAATGRESEASQLARATFFKDLHTAALYVVAGVYSAVAAITSASWTAWLLFAGLVPALLSLRYGRLMLRLA